MDLDLTLIKNLPTSFVKNAMEKDLFNYLFKMPSRVEVF
jgi:hypothetical protein